MNAIEVRGLSKSYQIRHEVRHDTLRDALSGGLRKVWQRWRGRPSPDKELFWALRDLEFDVSEGDVLGIVGGNGAGKSTLLKVLSRITEPTVGSIRLQGRVASLLEVGTGFHPELSGRENIFMNGAILGMSRREILAKFDEIVQFAEVERFLDTPVKRYSSGMYVRLAFAVAAHLEPEILIVDEVLAVGDFQFQNKCLNRMQEVSSSGRTVLFVSHNAAAVRALCTRAIVLEKGRLVLDGPVSATLEHYLARLHSRIAENGLRSWSETDAPQCSELRLDRIALSGANGTVASSFTRDSPITVEVGFTVLRALRGMRFVIGVATADATLAFSSSSETVTRELPPGPHTIRCTIPGRLLNTSRYVVNVHTGIPNQRELIPRQDYLTFEIVDAPQDRVLPHQRHAGVVSPQLDWQLDA